MIKQVLSQFYVCPSSMLSISDFQLPVREDESLRGIGTKLTAPREQGWVKASSIPQRNQNRRSGTGQSKRVTYSR